MKPSPEITNADSTKVPSETDRPQNSDAPLNGGSKRRTFLKQSGMVVAGTGLAASVTSLVQPVHAQGSASLKLGLVGCGGRGSGAALQALRADPNTELVAVAEAYQDRADRSLKNLKKDEAVGNRVNVNPDTTFIGLDAYKQVIEASDVVLLCTPPGFRPMHFKAAVEAGKHIFTEKPMATDFPGCRMVKEAVELSKEKGLAVLAGFCWRYHDAKRELFKRILAGEIGDIRAMHGTYLTGPVKPMPPADRRPDDVSDLWWQIKNWYNFTWLSGDGLVEQACHTVDWLAWAMGDQPPVSCTAVGGRQIPRKVAIFLTTLKSTTCGTTALEVSAQRQIPRCYTREQSLPTWHQGERRSNPR